MTDVIEFYFEFSSFYGYFASHKIDGLAEEFGRRAVWKPIMLGPIFQNTGNRPLLEQGIKAEYTARDCERMSRMMGVPWVLPDPFPIITVTAARAFYLIDDDDPELAKRFAKAAYHTYFGEGRTIAPPEAVLEVADSVGVDADALRENLQGPGIKQRLKDEVAVAMERGVCGSPFIIVDGEGFWGSDRLWMVKKWIREGGW